MTGSLRMQVACCVKTRSRERSPVPINTCRQVDDRLPGRPPAPPRRRHRRDGQQQCRESRPADHPCRKECVVGRSRRKCGRPGPARFIARMAELNGVGSRARPEAALEADAAGHSNGGPSSRNPPAVFERPMLHGGWRTVNGRGSMCRSGLRDRRHPQPTLDMP